VRHNCRGTPLRSESASRSLGCCEWRTQNLDGDVATERLIGCTEDKCGCTFANELLQPIPASDKIARLQRLLVAS
jgi:hypothetical protein